jgi:hypothetical protein
LHDSQQRVPLQLPPRSTLNNSTRNLPRCAASFGWQLLARLLCEGTILFSSFFYLWFVYFRVIVPYARL